MSWEFRNCPSSRGVPPTGSTPNGANWSARQCTLCDLIYDETQGLPDDGIPAGMPWVAVPKDWNCPDCGARKSDFRCG